MTKETYEELSKKHDLDGLFQAGFQAGRENTLKEVGEMVESLRVPNDYNPYDEGYSSGANKTIDTLLSKLDKLNP